MCLVDVRKEVRRMEQIPPMFDPALKPPLSERDAWVWNGIDAELAALVGRSSAEREANRPPRP
jgi:hypothetical protein